jgi:TIR domain
LEVSFSTDIDGFFSQECPLCKQRFKVLFGQGSKEPISYCPYCSYHGQQCWYTQEQIDYIKSAVTNNILIPKIQNLRFNLKGSLNLPSPIETDDIFDILHFPCCDKTIKATRSNQHFCIICGIDIDMTISDSKRIFLSHKGVDKEKVIDFKKTLKLLGYHPWLDEDAMPAGTSLERGLLRGMKDSCAVIFFITPSFKDEGFLQTEVDYAIAEKRRKGDKFAIISLQFDNDGQTGEIPELLKPYVWKKPKTLLDAVREIIRALPITVGSVDWRDEITGVITKPKIKSTLTELSAEAKAILIEAVSEASDGTIMFINGQSIGTNNQEMIPNSDPKTIALWVGGFEDLRRRRYIKDVENAGQVFKVTREGYTAATELREN